MSGESSRPGAGRYACAVVCQKGDDVSLLCFLVEAASRDEAMGKAGRIMRAKYPPPGWRCISGVIATDVVLDAEGLP